MKITKFAHSCVLVETPDRVGLFDPGDWSWDSGSFDINKLERMDDILITHEHTDHMYLPFIKTLLSRFPQASIITTEPAATQLRAEGINNVVSSNNEFATLFNANHESMEPLADAPPANTGIHYLDVFTSPGDSHHFAETKKVLALPITAPWGTTAKAAAIIEELRPEYVVPVHDWLWRDEICQMFYERLSAFCDKLGIQFIQTKNGEPIEID